MNKDTTDSLYNNIFKHSIEQMQSVQWADVKQELGSGIFGVTFTMSEIKCVSAVFDVASMSSRKTVIAPNQLSVSYIGPAMTYVFNVQYDLKIFGIHLMFGSGTITMASSNVNVNQAFTADAVTSTHSLGWTLTVSDISGFDLFGGIEAWLKYMTQNALSVTLISNLNTETSTQTMIKLKLWTVIPTPLYNDGSLNMILKSSLYSLIESPAGMLTLTLSTNVTVDKRPYLKRVWKAQKSAVTLPDGTLTQICVPFNLLVDMVEVRSKARDFLFSVDPTTIGLTGKLSDLMYIMPRLVEKFDPQEGMTIGCRPNGENDIMMIKDALTSDTGRIQIPLNCLFGAKSGKNVLSVNFYMRADVTKKVELADGLFTINGNVANPVFYSMKVDSYAAPVEQLNTLARVVRKIGALVNGFQLLPKPLSISAPFTPATQSKVVTDTEFCFNYA